MYVKAVIFCRYHTFNVDDAVGTGEQPTSLGVQCEGGTHCLVTVVVDIVTVSSV